MGEANRRKKLGLYPEKTNKPKPKKIKHYEIDMVTLLVLLSRSKELKNEWIKKGCQTEQK